METRYTAIWIDGEDVMKKPAVWQKVVTVLECTDIYGDGSLMACPCCGIEYSDCPCPGPHQDEEYEYEERDGVLWARRRLHLVHSDSASG